MLNRLWKNEEGQDVAEYAVMAAIILVIALATVRYIGSSAGKTMNSAAEVISSVN